MCDSVCAVSGRGTIFAKNSDRPPSEAQLVGLVPGRRPSGRLHAQYLELDDVGAQATVLARPDWLWGAEHGVNTHGVAIGNERVYTVHDAEACRPALLGMDLVRLGLERARSATEALEVMTGLLERHGQGGVGDRAHGECYYSSFLVADADDAWVLETAGRSWAARRVEGAEVLSNRLVLGRDWTRASAHVAPGSDWGEWRDPKAPTGHADLRLAAGRALLEGNPPGVLDAPALVAHLRDHGTGPWGKPGAAGRVVPPPGDLQPDFSGISVCMHVRGYMATTCSMVVELPRAGAPRRAYVAPGSPCVTVYVPCFPPQDGGAAVGSALGRAATWRAGAALRDLVEREPEALEEIRGHLDPLEVALWEEAEGVAAQPPTWGAAAEEWAERAAQALSDLAGRMAPSATGS